MLHDQRERDARDAARAIAPMKPAADAVVIDTTGSVDREPSSTAWPAKFNDTSAADAIACRNLERGSS